jgi:hypothetical protein
MKAGDKGPAISGAEQSFLKVPAMTAAAALCPIYCGQRRDTPKILKGIDILMANLPEWKEPEKDKVDLFYWLFGMQALGQQRATDKRAGWRDAVKKALLANQCLGGCADGTWDMPGRWGVIRGRVCTTAVGCMILSLCEKFKKNMKQR